MSHLPIIADRYSSAFDTLSKYARHPERYEIKDMRLIARSKLSSPSQPEREYIFLTHHVSLLNSAEREPLLSNAAAVQQLFFKDLARFKYDRSAISLGGRLEAVLDPNVAASHETEDELDEASGRRIRETLLETRFALRLGVRPEKAPSDLHEVFFVLNRFKERIGVFKPVSKHHGDFRRGAPLAEAASSAVARKIKLPHLVPHTEVITLNLSNQRKATGSYQFYVSNAPTLASFFKGKDVYQKYDKLKKTLDTPGTKQYQFLNFEHLAFYDMLTGDHDHHFKNILFKTTGPKTGYLVLIDNESSFPWWHRADRPKVEPPPYQYKWCALPHAKKGFSPEMVDFIQTFDVDSIVETMRSKLCDKTVPFSTSNFSRKVLALRERLGEIQKLSAKDTSIAQIARALLKLKHSTASKPNSITVSAASNPPVLTLPLSSTAEPLPIPLPPSLEGQTVYTSAASSSPIIAD